MKTTSGFGYEWIYDPTLPTLEEFYFHGTEGPFWDYDATRPVDMDELVRLGYCRKYRFTQEVEYL